MAVSAMQGSGEVTYTCRCSMLEIYNESVYDLLTAKGEDLDLHLKPRTEEVYVRGLSWEEVSTGMYHTSCLQTHMTSRCLEDSLLLGCVAVWR